MFVDQISLSNDNPSDPRNRPVVHRADDPFEANLKTPINSSDFTQIFINNLPAYRQGITVFRRGLEVGIAHGYWLIGPFVKLGPLRNTEIANIAGLLPTISLVLISALAISLYGSSNPPPPIATLTTPNPPAEFSTSKGWNEYGGGFLIGGIGGALLAYFLLVNVPLIQALISQ